LIAQIKKEQGKKTDREKEGEEKINIHTGVKLTLTDTHKQKYKHY
jgi:hypothetical protein